MNAWRILNGDCRAVLRTLPERSVQTVITSPPYFGLRDYGTASWLGGDEACDHKGPAKASGSSTLKNDGRPPERVGQNHHEREAFTPFRGVCGKCGAERVDEQIGLEPSPDEFAEAMVAVFREVRRVLRDDGTVWLNLGDSYAGGGGHAPDAPSNVKRRAMVAEGEYYDGPLSIDANAHLRHKQGGVKPTGDCKAKDLIGIPWLVAFALRADGWYLRSEVIWHKPNPMPESVTDRPTRAHEQIFLLTKSRSYFYDADAIRETSDQAQAEHNLRYAQRYDGPATDPANGQPGNVNNGGIHERAALDGKRNKRSVWTVTTKPFPGAHFATFPPDLIEPCVLAGSAERACGVCGAPWSRVTERVESGFDGSRYGERAVEATGGAISGGTAKSTLGSSHGRETADYKTLGWEPSCEHNDDTGTGVVLDPFCGAGTTGVVALRHNREFVGIELNPEYVTLARHRIIDDAPLLNSYGEQVA